MLHKRLKKRLASWKHDALRITRTKMRNNWDMCINVVYVGEYVDKIRIVLSLKLKILLQVNIFYTHRSCTSYFNDNKKMTQ